MQYCYRTKDGQLHHLTMTVREMQRRQRKNGTLKLPDGRVAKRDIAAEHNGFHDLSEKNFPKGHQDNWALACHPSNVAEFNAAAAQGGVATEHSPRDGSPQFTSHQHRRRYLKAFGFVDRSGYD